MGFFPLVNVRTPTFSPNPQELKPWEEGFGQTAITDLVLAQGPEGAVLLRSVIAFPSAMTLDVLAQLRQPLLDGPGTQGHNSPTFSTRPTDSPRTGTVLLGLLHSDGTRWLNIKGNDGDGTLLSLHGGGGSYRGQYTFVAPVPPEGRLEVWVAWPAASLPETMTVLDADPIRRASDSARTLWT